MTTGGSVTEIDLVPPNAPAIHADVHSPDGPSRGTVLIAHGFLGYKDYGMFPSIARSIAEAGWCGVRFNFAHSGMSRNTDTFEHADRFARSTWNRQVEDLHFLQNSIREGMIAGTNPDGPIVLLGHSRGGTAVILAAGRAFAENSGGLPRPDGVIALAAPADCDRYDDDTRKAFLKQGFTSVMSNRTGQELRIHREFLDEIAGDPVGHDVQGMIGHVACPVLLVHGEQDPTVPVSDVDRLAASATSSRDLREIRISGGNHVLNVSNPLPEDESSSQLDEFTAAVRVVLGAIGEQGRS